MTAEIL